MPAGGLHLAIAVLVPFEAGVGTVFAPLVFTVPVFMIAVFMITVLMITVTMSIVFVPLIVMMVFNAEMPFTAFVFKVTMIVSVMMIIIVIAMTVEAELTTQTEPVFVVITPQFVPFELKLVLAFIQLFQSHHHGIRLIAVYFAFTAVWLVWLYLGFIRVPDEPSA